MIMMQKQPHAELDNVWIAGLAVWYKKTGLEGRSARLAMQAREGSDRDAGRVSSCNAVQRKACLARGRHYIISDAKAHAACSVLQPVREPHSDSRP